MKNGSEFPPEKNTRMTGKGEKTPSCNLEKTPACKNQKTPTNYLPREVWVVGGGENELMGTLQQPNLIEWNTIGGAGNSVVTTDGSGNATVQVTLTGNPKDFVRAQTAP